MEVTCSFKGASSSVTLTDGASTDDLFAHIEQSFGLGDQKLKILFKGKQVAPGMLVEASPLVGASKPKVMVMATGAKEVAAVQAARSDPTVRGFQAEDQLAQHHLAQQQRTEELSEWAQRQDVTHRFCRFEACTWQSFGTRARDGTTPHAFEARALLLKLAQDPAIVSIMRAREYTVGLLAELDPIDDRHAEKMEGEGKRLLGYNTNAGAQIHIRLRTQDLSGFLPYPSLVDTLLHELCHNEIGPHNEQFWHLFCQLKADYLRKLSALSSRGDLFGGKSALTLAHAAEETRDVRSSVLGALSRDRQTPASPIQVQLLDGYLARTGSGEVAPGGGGQVLGGAAPGHEDAGPSSSAATSGASAAERREMLAARAAARLGVAEHRGQPAEDAAPTEAVLPPPPPKPPQPGEGNAHAADMDTVEESTPEEHTGGNRQANP